MAPLTILNTATSTLGGVQRGALWLAILAAQMVAVVLLVLDPRLAIGLVLGILLFVLALRYPYAAVLGVVATRLAATNALSIRVGPIFLSMFEPTYVLAFLALVIRSSQQRRARLHDFPASALFLGLLTWFTVSLAWSADQVEGLLFVIRVFIAFGIVWLIASEIRTPERFLQVFWLWLVVSATIGVVGVMYGDYNTAAPGDVSFQTMEGGARSGGLGQHPNWFGMAMAFGINPALAMAYVERRQGRRLLLVVLALIQLFVVLHTGSRGAFAGVVLGSIFLALHNERLRRYLYRYWFVILVLLAGSLILGAGSFNASVMRVVNRSLGTLFTGNVRFNNWTACYEMLVQTLGLGIGAGSYAKVVGLYDARVAMNYYAYPHGVFWDIMAHYGIVGLTLFGVLWWRIYHRFRAACRAVRGTSVEIWLIGMLAGYIGYWSHSFVEFHLEDKPAWMFLGILLGLIGLADRLGADPKQLEPHRLVKSGAAAASTGDTAADTEEEPTQETP